VSSRHDLGSLLSALLHLLFRARYSCLTMIALCLCGTVLLPAAKAQSPKSAAAPPPPPVKQVIYSPFAGIGDFAKWEIEVANRSADDVPATVTAYSSDGRPFPPFSFQLGGNSIQRIDIRGLVPAALRHQVQGNEVTEAAADGGGSTVGGITVEVVAKPFAVASQVTLSDFRGGFGNIDSILLPDIMFITSRADAVWWEPDGGQSVLILGNSSSDSLTAELIFGSGHRQSVTLAPKATQLVDVPDDREHENIKSVHVVGSGAPGTLRVSGYAISKRNAFLNVIRAYDPAISTEPTLYANGLHFSNAANHLVVKNLTGSPINVWGAIYPTTSGGSVQNVEIPKQFLEPYASAEMTLPPGSDALDGAALKLESSGSAGSFAASYVSHAQVDHITRSMPFKDIGDRANATGGYPWRLDGNYESHTYITNIGKVRAAFGAFIDPKNGIRYVIDTRFLEPGETTIIDYRNLRDEQIPDRNGLTLPRDVKFGAVQWFPLFFDGSQRFIGRTELLDRSTGAASSFSCGSCPCSPNVNGSYISPNPVSVPVGGTASVRATVTLTDPCGFNVVPDFNLNVGSWNAPPFIHLTTGSTTSTLTGVSVGSGSYSTSYTSDYYIYNPYQSQQCTLENQNTTTPTGSANVTPPTATITVRLSGAKSSTDHLRYGIDSCSENLGGPLVCVNTSPSGWFWNAEVSAVVSDDASKWTVTQTKDSGRNKGFFKDSSGILHPFDTGVTSILCPPCDGPMSTFLQQTAGTKNIFYLDAPGPFMTTVGGTVDSTTLVDNFTAHFCSTVVPTACFTKQWYVKIVIAPGRLVSGSSSAGLGTQSTNF
jgi:hypothetical protein